MFPSILKAEAIAEAPGDNEMSKLLKQHYNASLELTKADYQSFVASVAGSTLEPLLNDSRRLVTAGLEIHARKQDKLAFLKQMAELSLDLDTIINDSFQAGKANVADVKRSEQFKLEMKILMLRTKGE